MLNRVIVIGPAVLAMGLLLAAVAIALRLLAPRRRGGATLPSFLLRIFGIGLGGFVVGTAIGIAVFCSSAGSGNLCGLGGVFGIGPLFSGLGMGWYALASFGRSRGAPDAG